MMSNKYLLCAALLASLGSACGDGLSTTTGAITEGRVAGRVVDDPSATRTGLSGAHTRSSTATVQILAVYDTGDSRVIATSQIDAQGVYEINVPRHDGVLMAQAVDGAGVVLASAIIEEKTRPNDTVRVQPMNAESSLEAMVLLDMVARGGAHATETDLVDLRARIDARTALAVNAASSLEGNVHALASAALTAQAAVRHALQSRRADVDRYRAAELSLAVTLNGQLAVDDGSSARAYTQFEASLDGLYAQVSLDDEAGAQVEMRASASARLVMSATARDQIVIDAAARAFARRESRASARAMIAIATRGRSTASVLTSLQSANETFVVAVEGAADARAVDGAYASWRTQVRASFTTPGGWWENLVGAAIAVTLDNLIELGVSLQGSFRQDFERSLGTNGEVDAVAFVGRIDGRYTAFASDMSARVRAAFTTLDNGTIDVTSSALVVAAGSYR